MFVALAPPARGERLDLLADAFGAGRAARSSPDPERSLECFTRLVDPSCALEHGGKVLVCERPPPDVVRPGLSSRDRRARQRLRLLELASRASSSASAAAASTRTPEPGGGTARASSRSRSASSKRPRGSKDRVQDATSPSPPGPRSGPPRSPHRGGGGIFWHLAACARVRATEIGRRSVRPRGA